jgi:hypothetical protein
MSATSTLSASRSARTLAAAALAVVLGGCSAQPIVDRPAQAPVVPFVVPPDANVELVVTEAVSGPEQDTASYTKIFIGGRLAGQTPVAPRSQERRWADRVPAGNHLIRLEQWYLPNVGDWGMLDPQLQPPERFVRVEEGGRTSIQLKFLDGARRHQLSVSRKALP